MYNLYYKSLKGVANSLDIYNKKYKHVAESNKIGPINKRFCKRKFTKRFDFSLYYYYLLKIIKTKFKKTEETSYYILLAISYYYT